MQVSRELDYGVRAIVSLCRHEGEVLSKRRIADEFSIPINFLALILPKLVHHGLVESLPGPKGGYRLAKKSRSISMYDVVQAVDEDFAINRCLDERQGCELSESCPITPVWKRIQDAAVECLKDATFDRLLENT
jgi:Rrf2 family iron-sulfur cluster assembly transcriptional regulator